MACGIGSNTKLGVGIMTPELVVVVAISPSAKKETAKGKKSDNAD
jgi:hypothetical protein